MELMEARGPAPAGQEEAVDPLAYIEELDAPVRDVVAPWAKLAEPALASRCHLERIGAGRELVRMLEPCTRVFLLTRGRVRTTSHDESGARFTIDEFSAPAVFGEMEVIADSPCFYGSLVALTDCEFLSFPREDYLAWLSSTPAVLLDRSRSAMRRLLRQMGNERRLMGWTSAKRLMFVLARRLAREPQGTDVTIRVTRCELAESTSLSTKSVTRALDELEARGLVRRRGRSLIIDRRSRGRLDEAVRHELENALPQGQDKEEL